MYGIRRVTDNLWWQGALTAPGGHFGLLETARVYFIPWLPMYLVETLAVPGLVVEKIPREQIAHTMSVADVRASSPGDVT